ncbi:MAG: glutamine-hydrolyzing GMP synthase [Chloroflexi bacterium]|nr:glutamine-hydrolyzing GMP synthase [Chloroflexota bacterium]
MPDTIVILDFGSQYTQLIARRVRELHVYCELLPHDAPREEIERLKPRGIILSGGPASVYDEGAAVLPGFMFDLHVPLLGICYGLHLLAQALGGRVARSERQEYGPAVVQVDEAAPLFAGLPASLPVWMSHGDQVTDLPQGFGVLAHSDTCAYAAVADPARKIYGLQFHPEVSHTPQGQEILRHFLFDICGCSGDWTPAAFIDSAVRTIRDQVGAARGGASHSRGVDSTVAATLVGRAIGERLVCVFVDHGLLRAGEARSVADLFHRQLGLEVVTVQAQDRFLGKLRGVVDPEAKRKIIGTEFVRVFEETSRELHERALTRSPDAAPIRFLAQGTLYPDVIESRGRERQAAARIKTHHNVGGLPEDLEFELIEPLRYLFKDEVRAVALELGLPEQVAFRQPFPGPGLAVRILGPVTEQGLAILQAADAIVREEIEAAGLARDVWQYFAILTPLKTVGVMGDGRTYDHVVAVRAVTSADGMTADWARLPHPVLARISTRIVNEVRGVNRVVYDITSKPPGTIEWE